VLTLGAGNDGCETQALISPFLVNKMVVFFGPLPDINTVVFNYEGREYVNSHRESGV
jgi:hypothetical protein